MTGKMAKIDILFMAIKAEKTIPFGDTRTFVAHTRNYPPIHLHVHITKPPFWPRFQIVAIL